MAAHLKTGLEQVLDKINEGKIEEYKPILKSATELSCWTEDANYAPEFNAWQHIVDFLENKTTLWTFKNQIESDLVDATAEWIRRGRPSCREEWYKAKYG